MMEHSLRGSLGATPDWLVDNFEGLNDFDRSGWTKVYEMLHRYFLALYDTIAT